MYRPSDSAPAFLGFNQPMGLRMNPDNRLMKVADSIPWDELESNYVGFFPSGTGNVAKLLRMELGVFIIQTKFQYSDMKLMEQVAENPYLQCFIGCHGSQEDVHSDVGVLVLFRRHIAMG